MDVDICVATGIDESRVSTEIQTYLQTERLRQQLAAASKGSFDADSTPVLLKHSKEYKAVFGMVKTAQVGVPCHRQIGADVCN